MMTLSFLVIGMMGVEAIYKDQCLASIATTANLVQQSWLSLRGGFVLDWIGFMGKYTKLFGGGGLSMSTILHDSVLMVGSGVFDCFCCMVLMWNA